MDLINLSGFTNLEKGEQPREGEIRHWKDGDYKFEGGHWKKQGGEIKNKENKKYPGVYESRQYYPLPCEQRDGNRMNYKPVNLNLSMELIRTLKDTKPDIITMQIHGFYVTSNFEGDGFRLQTVKPEKGYSLDRSKVLYKIDSKVIDEFIEENKNLCSKLQTPIVGDKINVKLIPYTQDGDKIQNLYFRKNGIYKIVKDYIDDMHNPAWDVEDENGNVRRVLKHYMNKEAIISKVKA